MPYITQDRRKQLDPQIEYLSTLIKTNGEVNYVISKLIDSLYGDTYDSFNSAIGILACVAQEYYRKRIAIYEDTKELENGEVFE